MADAGAALPERAAVCVCTADRPALLARLLDHLAEALAPYADAMELLLVVCDNRPGRGAAAVVEAARPRLPCPVVLAEEPQPGISYARNRAVATALAHGAGLVAFIDDDDLPRPDWLAKLLETRALTGADLVFGCQRPSPDMPIPSWAMRVTLFDRKPRPQLNAYGVPAGASTCNVLLSRALLEDLGGPDARDGVFRPEFARVGGGDTDLFVRAARRGHAFAVSPESEVWLMWEQGRLGWRGLGRRAFRFGVTRWHLRVAHGEPAGRPAEARRIAAALWEKGVRVARGTSGKRRFAREWFRFVEQVGEAYALLGGSFDYYGIVKRAPPPSPQPVASAASAAATAAGRGGAGGAEAGPTTPPSPMR